MLHDDVIDLYNSYILLDIVTGALSDLKACVSGLKARLLDQPAPLRALTAKKMSVNAHIARRFYP